MTNTLAYYDAEIITSVKSFIVQDPHEFENLWCRHGMMFQRLFEQDHLKRNFGENLNWIKVQNWAERQPSQTETVLLDSQNLISLSGIRWWSFELGQQEKEIIRLFKDWVWTRIFKTLKFLNCEAKEVDLNYALIGNERFLKMLAQNWASRWAKIFF